MALVIDGYNLLHASGILGRGVGPGSLERSRLALLNFLAQSLDPGRTGRHDCCVRRARSAPGFAAASPSTRGCTCILRRAGSDADEAIEILIKLNTSPRRLTVVSSDHRLHRAAKRRKATPVDSDVWYASIVRRRIERAKSGNPAGGGPKPIGGPARPKFVFGCANSAWKNRNRPIPNRAATIGARFHPVMPRISTSVICNCAILSGESRTLPCLL